MLTDIGICLRQADGSWSKPARLGPAVNMEAFERFPSLARNGRYLFFIRSLNDQFVGFRLTFAAEKPPPHQSAYPEVVMTAETAAEYYS